MHDLGTFRSNLDTIAQRLSTRGVSLPVDQFRELDARRRAAITETEELRQHQNVQSREIAILKKDGVDTTEQQRLSREMGDRIAELANIAEEADASYRELLAGVPNVPHESVPAGKSAEDNVTIRTWGDPRKFDFGP